VNARAAAPITTRGVGASCMASLAGGRRLVENGFHGILSPEFAFSGTCALFLTTEILPMSMFIGEALSGDGNEIAHIDLLIGSKDGPVGVAFANALARQSEGHTNLLAVLTPNLAVKPATVMITKVTIKGMKQAVQMFGPAQAAVAKAVADSVAAGVIPKSDAENLVIVCGVFIHPAAADDKKIYDYNYEATKLAIANAMKGSPSADEMIAGKDKAAHPFRGF
jgi:5,6,7,8-tetrahydromethanopterin hydro-lyase